MNRNHLQFIRHEETFDSKDAAINFVNDNKSWEYGEPLVVKYKNDDGVEEVLFAIGNGDENSGVTFFDPSDGGAMEELIGNIIEGVGLNENGEYVADEDDSILSAATSVVDAETLLSKAIEQLGSDAVFGVSNSGTPIELSIVTDSETNKKLITGDVKIVNTDTPNNYNILEKVSLDSQDPKSQKYLYVRGTADNIIYGGDNASVEEDITVETALDGLFQKVDDLDKKIDDTNIRTENTSSVKLELEEEEGTKDILKARVRIAVNRDEPNQLIVNAKEDIESDGNGLYHHVDLRYNNSDNILSLWVNGDEKDTIQLMSVSIIERIEYDPDSETITVYYKLSDGTEQFITISIRDIINEWTTIDSPTLHLERVPDAVISPETGIKRDGLSGDVLVVDSRLVQYVDNILEKTDDGLFVNGSGITKNAEDIAAEKTARESADNTITENLNTEATTREENDNKIAESAGFDSSYGYIQDRNTNYIADAESLANADKKLDEAIGVVSGKSDTNAEDIATVSGVVDSVSGKLDTTIVGAGLKADGTYIVNHDAKYLNHAESLADADNKLDAALSELSDIVAKNELVVNDSTSIDFTLDKTSDKTALNGNVIVSQRQDNNITIVQTIDEEKGLYSKAELSYDEPTNTLTFTNSKGSASYVLAGITSFIEEITYDPRTESIIIKYISKGETKTLVIPVGDIIEEWDVNPHNASGDSLSYGIILHKERNIENKKDILSARIQLSDKTDNMVEFDSGKIYVSSSAITRNSENIAIVSGAVENLETEIATEVTNRTNADNELSGAIGTNKESIDTIKETIGDGFTPSETQTITYKYNTLSSDVQTNKESIETLNDKVDELSGQVKDNSFSVESTNSVTLTKTEYTENPDIVKADVKVSNTENNNLNINDDGLYTKAILNYDVQSNKLAFETNNGTKEIVLSGTSLLTNNVDHNVEINIVDSVITSDVRVANNGKYSDNIIEVVSTTQDGKNPALYVNPSGITKNAEDIETLSGNVGTISDNLDAEIARATAKEAELEAEIGEIKTYEVDVNDTDTIDLETTSSLTPSGTKETISANAKFSDANDNIVKNNNGIYAKVGLSFNDVTNELVFSTTNGSTNISLESLAEDLTPSNEMHNAVVVIDGKNISVDTTIASGDSFNDNMISVVSTTLDGKHPALYVSPSAVTKNANDISAVSGVVNSIVTSADTLNTKIENEIARAINKENELDAKIDEVSGEIKSYKVNVQTTDTVTLTKTESTTTSGTEANISADVNIASPSDNIIKNNNGVYAKVDISFDSNENNLVLTTTNGDKNISLESLSLTPDNDTHNVNINIGNQKISADVAVATEGNYSDNMLKVVYTTDDNKNPALYVSPSAVTKNTNDILNIKADVNAISGTLNTAVSDITTLRTDVNTISGNVGTVSALANTNKLNIETVSSIVETNKATIGTGFTNTEGNTVTAKFNELVSRVDTHDNKISDLEQFSADTNTSIGTINTQISRLTAQTESLQPELDRTQVGAGLNTNGEYVPNTSTNYLKTAQSLKDADEILDATLNALSGKVTTDENNISTLSGVVSNLSDGKADKFGVNDTNSITLTMTTSEEDGNVLVANSRIDPDVYNNIKITSNGLYSKFGLSYAPATNVLTYIDKDGSHDIQLNSGSIIDSIEYDAASKVLVITYKTSTSSEAQTVTVPISDLNSVRVQDGNHLGGIQLTATTESGITVISASTVISTDSTNILVNDNGVLKVDGVASNILFSKDDPTSGSVFTVIASLASAISSYDERIAQLEAAIERLEKLVTIVSSETDTDIVTSEVTADGYTKINVTSKTANVDENLIDVKDTETVSDNGIYFDGSQDNGKF